MKRKAKHLKGKQNQKISLGLGPQMLRLSGLEDQELQLAYWAGGEEKTSGEIFHFYCIKFLNLVCQLSCSSTLGMVPVLEITLTGQFSVTVEARNKNPGV